MKNFVHKDTEFFKPKVIITLYQDPEDLDLVQVLPPLADCSGKGLLSLNQFLHCKY